MRGHARSVRPPRAAVQVLSWFRTYETGEVLQLCVWQGTRQGCVHQAPGVVCGCASPGLGAGPLCDGVMGGELLDSVSAGVGRDGEGVELDDLAGTCGLAAPGQASGVWSEAPGGARSVAAQARDRDDRAALHQGLEDAARGALACRVPVASEQDGDLGLAPHRVVGACLPDRRHQRRRPGGPARGVRAARARLEAVAVRQPPPPVEGRSRNADGVGGRSCGQAVGPGLAPALKGVAPVRFVAPLLAAQARRQGGSSCNMARQAEGLHGGSPSRCLFDTNSVGDPRLYIKARVSHLSDLGRVDEFLDD